MYLPYDEGGLEQPNLQWYIWAARLRAEMFWFSREVDLPCLQTELLSSRGLVLSSFLEMKKHS